MAQLKYRVVSEMSTGADQLRAIAQAVQDAGGEPDLEMPRLVSQPGLAKKIGVLIMDTLFTESQEMKLLGHQIPRENYSADFLATYGWNRLIDTPSPKLYDKYWQSQESQEIPDPGTIMLGYKYVRINRSMHGSDLWKHFEKRQNFPVCTPREVLGVCKFSSMRAKLLSSEFRQKTHVLCIGGIYKGWSLYLNLDERTYFLVDFTKVSYPAGTLVVTH